MPKTSAVARQIEKEGEAPRELSAEALISQAISANVPVENLERLMAMRRELKAEQAREQFDRDMAAFQAECPVIQKTKEARDNTKVLYKYAPLDSIVEQVSGLLGKYGFSHSFQTSNSADRVTVTCIVKHRGGYNESSTMETSLATRTGIMSGPQQVASTVTFNKRYAFCNAFGILTGDEDVEPSDPRAVATDEEVEAAINFISHAVSLDGLREAYSKLGKEKLVKKVIEAKDKRKKELSK